MTDKSRNQVIIWLLSGALLVASMVIIGGITRLTHSGLSMVEWKLIMGIVPPLSETEWQETFDKYKEFPEYKQINHSFALSDFKSIFWWEYIHRLLGRVIGIVFIIPFVVFLVQRRFNRKMVIKLMILLAMGAFQGFMGWYMVKSGLVNDPNVSHLRLAAHLVTAFIVCAYIIWLVLDLLLEKKGAVISIPTFGIVLKYLSPVILLQIVYGAFVAGMKAGYFYPTFPKMGNELVPISISNKWATQGWASLVNDLTTVQFIHRWIGVLIFFVVIGLFLIYRPSVLKRDRVVFDSLIWLVILQASLGILTLILSMPIAIAVLHQIIALLVLLSTVWNIHRFRNIY